MEANIFLVQTHSHFLIIESFYRVGEAGHGVRTDHEMISPRLLIGRCMLVCGYAQITRVHSHAILHSY